jgi:hypothetical protein
MYAHNCPLSLVMFFIHVTSVSEKVTLSFILDFLLVVFGDAFRPITWIEGLNKGLFRSLHGICYRILYWRWSYIHFINTSVLKQDTAFFFNLRMVLLSGSASRSEVVVEFNSCRKFLVGGIGLMAEKGQFRGIL